MRGEEITIRSIQHYMYCPHRWGLLEIDKAWAENVFVTKANLMHERVHDPDRNYTARGRKVYTSVPVYNDLEEYNLYGVTDCLECKESKDGVDALHDGRKYKLCIVEYKPTKPKQQTHRRDDLMQVFAQKLCVDYVFQCDCETVLYYADVKRRIPVDFTDTYQKFDGELRWLLSEMRSNLKEGIIPPIRKGQHCSGCSMKDLCMPSLKKSYKFQKELRRVVEEDL
ncbi:MAG: Dna2/Cas4 domain-containing protein [Firmicutes bacterium]|nr:Dna2/Cas4 domain-containing protein [Bacillota bacterium]